MDVKALLEVVLEGKVEEGPLGLGQLHAGGQPPLHEGQVAHGKVLVQIGYIAAHLDTVGGGQSGGIQAGSRHNHHPQPRNLSACFRIGLHDAPHQRAAHTRAAHGDDAHFLIGVVAQLLPQFRRFAPLGWIVTGDVAAEVEMILRPVLDSRHLRAEEIGHDILRIAHEDGPVPHPGKALDVLDHFLVVIGRQAGLPFPAFGKREETHEVGEPGQRAALQFGMLVPEVIHVPGLVGDDQVVVALLHHLLEDHEVVDQDLVHVAQGLKTVQVVLAALVFDVGGLVGQQAAGGVNTLAGVL